MSDQKETRPEDLAKLAELREAVGNFLLMFTAFETLLLTRVLEAMSTDALLVEFLPELMDLSRRLKLLRYLGDARKIPPPLKDDLRAVCNAAEKLSEHRNDIAHGYVHISQPPIGGGGPDYTSDTVAGVRKPRSKWKMPDDARSLTDEQLSVYHRDSLITVPMVQECGAAAALLARATQDLAEKIMCYRRGEDWQSRVVTKVTGIPKR